VAPGLKQPRRGKKLEKPVENAWNIGKHTGNSMKLRTNPEEMMNIIKKQKNNYEMV